MMATISFKDIVKLVHPDHNPNIQDAGAKMALVVANRRNETMLHNLGVQWGLIKVTTAHQAPRTHTVPPRQAPKPPMSDYDMFRRRHRIFQPGDMVFIRTKGRFGVVTRVTTTRVYFSIDGGKETYAAKKNVRF